MERVISPFAHPRQWIAIGFVGTYFLMNAVARHLDAPHCLLGALLVALYFAHDRTRRFLATFFPMLVYLLIYDSLHLVPREWHLPVHVDLLYRWDAALFGIPPHEWFRTHHWPVADLVAAVTYSLHYIGPLGFGLWLWYRASITGARVAPPRDVANGVQWTPANTLRSPFPFSELAGKACWVPPSRSPCSLGSRSTTAQFAWAFCALNLASLCLQLLLPTAPPWYTNQYGLHPADPLMAGDAAGLLRVDALLGRPYFTNMYRMSAVVFGAMPSMHAAWPVLMLCFSRGISRTARWALIGYGTLMWCSAVYLQHHFVVDLLVGGAMAVAAAWSVRRRGLS